MRRFDALGQPLLGGDFDRRAVRCALGREFERLLAGFEDRQIRVRAERGDAEATALSPAELPRAADITAFAPADADVEAVAIGHQALGLARLGLQCAKAGVVQCHHDLALPRRVTFWVTLRAG